MDFQPAHEKTGDSQPRRIELDLRAHVSRSDLVYLSPVENPLEGQPIGNGRMATLVWTTPEAIHFQINRSDIFGVDKTHKGDTMMGATDYAGGCAWVTVEPGGQVFGAGASFGQQLSVYQAECTITGASVRVRCFVSADTDVLVLEVDDQRADPQPLRVTLSMWRPPEVKSGDHTARSEFRQAKNAIGLVQRFDEREYHCASAVVAGIAGQSVQTESLAENSISLVSPGRREKTLVCISSAGALGTEGSSQYPWSPQTDVYAKSLELLAASLGAPYDLLRQGHDRWWSDFWSRTFVYLRSPDGLAEFMQCVRYLQLYCMAITSRGMFPPVTQGMLFSTGGDKRMWGSQFWTWDTELIHYPLFAADADDLLAPFFRMYRAQLSDCETAARQRWGCEGAFYPETTPFGGPLELPEDVAQEFRDVFQGRKKNTGLSARAQDLGSFESHLAVLCIGIAHPEGMIDGRYTFISHILSTGCELAVQAWWRYRYTGDLEWLKVGAYPLLRSTVEFYRHYARMGPDGFYHIHDANVHERFWGVRDGIMDLSAIRGTFPLAIRAAEILEVDEGLRSEWREFLARLPAYPLGSETEAAAITGGLPTGWPPGAIEDAAGGALAEDAWAAGYLGAAAASFNYEQVWLTPVFPFEDYTLATPDESLSRVAQRTYDVLPDRLARLAGTKAIIWERTPIFAARLARAQELPDVLASHYSEQHIGILANGFGLWQGEQTPSIEHMAGIGTAVQETLLQSLSPRPGQPEVLVVFPACPESWDAAFSLLARGGFLVTSVMHAGQVEFVELESRLGETCRLRNPWGNASLVIDVDGVTTELAGEIVHFDTSRGQKYLVYPSRRQKPGVFRIAPETKTGLLEYAFTLQNGKTVRGRLGRP